MLTAVDSTPATATVLLQLPVDIGRRTVVVLLGSAVVGFLSTLLVGGILVTILPESVEDWVAVVADSPGRSFVNGIVATFGIVFLCLLLFFIPFLGVIAILPLSILWVVWAVGNVVACLAVADTLVTREDGWSKSLVVAAAINAGLAFTGIGAFLGMLISSFGVGAMLDEHV